MPPFGISERFEAPAPGAWELESTHMTAPVSRWTADVVPAACTTGFRRSMARYGLLLEGFEFAVVNGFSYGCARGVGAPKGAKGPPPKFIFKLLLKIHPELRRRLRRIEEVFRDKFWRADVERWDREVKPAFMREYESLQKIDPSKLPIPELVTHLKACRKAVAESVERHHEYNACAMLTLGDFLVHVREWTGLQPPAVLPLLRGASEVSLGSTPQLKRLVELIAGRDDVKVLLSSQDPSAVLDALSAQQGEIGELARAYIASTGIRIANGYDVAGTSAMEMPELLVNTIRAAIDGSAAAAADTLAADTARIRALVPPQHHEKFDELLADARLTYRIRDERAYLNDAWATGIARRALLVAADHLVASRRLHDRNHVFDLTNDEIVSALQGGPSPSPDDVAWYYQYRTTKTTADAPRFLNFEPSPPPPADWLPPAAARAARAVEIVLGEMFARRDEQSASAGTISGFAASPGTVISTARLVLDASDMSLVRSGDILVTRATSPSYNAVLPLIRGIVTDRGGTLSHAAVVAREFGIPAVVGCGNATAIIRDGAKVEIDGAAGTVRVIG